MALATPVAWELRPVQLTDRDTFNAYLSGLCQPISDYTFAQVYGWRTALDLWWRVIDGHLCVFANGSNLSMLMPPIAPPGTPGMQRALRRACEVMYDYNAEVAARDGAGRVVAPRIETVSDELLARVPQAGYARESMAGDYVYDVREMIELAGGAFKSKRHDKNHFTRAWTHRAEPFDVSRHAEPAARLLELWHTQSDAVHAGEDTISTIKRHKETLAAAAQMLDADVLGLTGLCVWVGSAATEAADSRTSRLQQTTANVEVRTPDRDPSDESGHSGTSVSDVRRSRFDVQPPSLAAFTLGEPLGRDMSSIIVEKARRDLRGLAQFIFSEFCRACWADRPLVNAGDDWGLESLARTKQSYRPVKMLAKHALVRLRPVSVFMPRAKGRPIADPCLTSESGSQTAEGRTSLASALRPQPRVLSRGRSIDLTAVTAPEPPIVFRAAELADLEAARALEQQCFNDTFPLSSRQLRHHQKSRSSVFLVAARESEAGSRVVGEGIALIRRHRTAGGCERTSGRIYTLAVDPAERGRGTGRRLLQVMLDQLAARGVGRVFLEVADTNTAAIALYQQLGFADIGTLPDYYAPGKHAKHMMKPLPSPQPSPGQVAPLGAG